MGGGADGGRRPLGARPPPQRPRRPPDPQRPGHAGGGGGGHGRRPGLHRRDPGPGPLRDHRHPGAAPGHVGGGRRPRPAGGGGAGGGAGRTGGGGPPGGGGGPDDRGAAMTVGTNETVDLSRRRRIHIVGVGGAAMGG